MPKTFRLPLLAALPALLLACDTPDTRAQNTYQEQQECAWYEDDDTHNCYEEEDGLSLKKKKPSSYNSASGMVITPPVSKRAYSAPSGVSRGGFTTSPRSSGSVGG